MSDLRIVIPTYRRMPRQATLGNLPESWMSRTTLVVDEHDAGLKKLYDLRGANIVVHPPHIKTIAQKRAWIILNWGLVCDTPKIFMLDDDLRFAVRDNIDGGSVRLRQATSVDLEDHLRVLESFLDHYVHAGWSARQGNNNVKDRRWVDNTRMMFALGYRCDLLTKWHDDGEIEIGRIELREDMDLTLQLLRRHHANTVDFDIATDQVAGYAARGGCSEQRTVADSDADAEKLAQLHPGLVKVVEKSYKGSVNRKEVIVQWKKAFEESAA